MSTSILGSWNVWWLSDWRIISLSDNVRRYINDVEHADAICFLQTLGQICLLLLRKWTKVPIQKHILHNHKNLVPQDIERLKSQSEVAPYLFLPHSSKNIFQTSPKIMGFLPFSAQLQPRENPKVLHWPPKSPMMRQQPQWQQRRRRFFARLGEVWKPRWVGDVFCCWPKKGSPQGLLVKVSWRFMENCTNGMYWHVEYDTSITMAYDYIIWIICMIMLSSTKSNCW